MLNAPHFLWKSNDNGVRILDSSTGIRKAFDKRGFLQKMESIVRDKFIGYLPYELMIRIMATSGEDLHALKKTWVSIASPRNLTKALMRPINDDDEIKFSSPYGSKDILMKILKIVADHTSACSRVSRELPKIHLFVNIRKRTCVSDYTLPSIPLQSPKNVSILHAWWQGLPLETIVRLNNNISNDGVGLTEEEQDILSLPSIILEHVDQCKRKGHNRVVLPIAITMVHGSRWPFARKILPVDTWDKPHQMVGRHANMLIIDWDDYDEEAKSDDVYDESARLYLFEPQGYDSNRHTQCFSDFWSSVCDNSDGRLTFAGPLTKLERSANPQEQTNDILCAIHSLQFGVTAMINHEKSLKEIARSVYRDRSTMELQVNALDFLIYCHELLEKYQ
jgi:hypothetical protein